MQYSRVGCFLYLGLYLKLFSLTIWPSDDKPSSVDDSLARSESTEGKAAEISKRGREEMMGDGQVEASYNSAMPKCLLSTDEVRPATSIVSGQRIDQIRRLRERKRRVTSSNVCRLRPRFVSR